MFVYPSKPTSLKPNYLTPFPLSTYINMKRKLLILRSNINYQEPYGNTREKKKKGRGRKSSRQVIRFLKCQYQVVRLLTSYQKINTNWQVIIDNLHDITRLISLQLANTGSFLTIVYWPCQLPRPLRILCLDSLQSIVA